MANQGSSDPSIGSSQRSNPSTSSLTDGSGERFLDNESMPNINPSATIANHPSARADDFPSSRQSSSEMELSIAVGLLARTENEQISGSRSNINVDGNFEDYLISNNRLMEIQAWLRALMASLRTDRNRQFEELVVQQEQNGDMGMGLTEEEIMECIGYETLGSICEESTENKEACSICQEDYVKGEDVGRLDCAHKFHVECIKQWLKLRNICPICRRMALMPNALGLNLFM